MSGCDALTQPVRLALLPGRFAAWRLAADVLDFGLTGVLAALTAPVAQAGISVFVLATYDMDYLLVKMALMQWAVKVLQAQGMPFKRSSVLPGFAEDNNGCRQERICHGACGDCGLHEGWGAPLRAGDFGKSFYLYIPGKGGQV